MKILRPINNKVVMEDQMCAYRSLRRFSFATWSVLEQRKATIFSVNKEPHLAD